LVNVPARRFSRLQKRVQSAREARALDANGAALRYKKSVFHRHFRNTSKFCARSVAAEKFIAARFAGRHSAFAPLRRGAALTHKIKWSHCYFFPAVVIG
jgi:hypothetical protein